MGTAVAEVSALSVAKIGEILGPDSPYEKQRLALRKEYAPIIAAAAEIVVIDSPELQEKATGYGRLLQTATKETEAFYKSIKIQIDAVKKPVLESEKQDVGSIETEKQRIAGLVNKYTQKVRLEQQEAERKARLEAEDAARADQLARAIELESAGELEQAEAVLEEELAPLPVVVQHQAPVKVAGQVSKVTYSMTVVDLMTLVKAVAAGTAPIQAVVANDSFLNAQARAFKDGFAIAGCKLNRDEGVHFRS